jgi:hypothetical protein
MFQIKLSVYRCEIFVFHGGEDSCRGLLRCDAV